MNRPYTLSVWYDADGEVWVCEADELEGCVAHGDTPAEATELFTHAKRVWLKAALKLGAVIPQPRTRADVRTSFSGKILLRLPRDLHEALASRAGKQGVSLNHYATSVLARALGSDEVRADVEWLADAYQAVLGTHWIQARAHEAALASTWITNVIWPNPSDWPHEYLERLGQLKKLEFTANPMVAEIYGKATEKACH